MLGQRPPALIDWPLLALGGLVTLALTPYLYSLLGPALIRERIAYLLCAGGSMAIAALVAYALLFGILGGRERRHLVSINGQQWMFYAFLIGIQIGGWLLLYRQFPAIRENVSRQEAVNEIEADRRGGEEAIRQFFASFDPRGPTGKLLKQVSDFVDGNEDQARPKLTAETVEFDKTPKGAIGNAARQARRFLKTRYSHEVTQRSNRMMCLAFLLWSAPRQNRDDDLTAEANECAQWATRADFKRLAEQYLQARQSLEKPRPDEARRSGEKKIP